MTIGYTSEDILRELHRRRIQEYEEQIHKHQQAILRLEETLVAIVTPDELRGPQETPESYQKPQRLPEPTPPFGPCASTLLELIEASKLPVSETELLRRTRYTPLMFRKATVELVAAKKIIRIGDSRKTLFSRYTGKT